MTTPSYAALDHSFTVNADDPAIAAVLADILTPLVVPPPHEGVSSAGYHAAWLPDGSTRLTCDDEVIATGEPAFSVAMLLWHINTQAVVRSGRYVVLHAAAAARGQAAVLLPGGEEFGKTTLVAGLVRAGLDYLTDELVAIEPRTLEICSYPKSLSIDEGSWGVLADLRPESDPSLAHATPFQWQVHAERIRAGATAATTQPALVIAPRYSPGATTKLSKVSGAQGYASLAKAAFGVGAHPDRDLDTLSRVASLCDCYELQVGDLDDACALVLGLFDELGVANE